MKKKNLSVTTIGEGMLIDHITAGQGLRVMPFGAPFKIAKKTLQKSSFSNSGIGS